MALNNMTDAQNAAFMNKHGLGGKPVQNPLSTGPQGGIAPAPPTLPKGVNILPNPRPPINPLLDTRGMPGESLRR